MLRVALSHDRKAYRGKDFIVVVVLESATKGDVFELTREDHGKKRSFRIENNGSFKVGHKGMEWPGEILGGIWTHEYMDRNIRRLLTQPSIAVTVRTALRFDPKLTCSSYLSD